MGMEKASAVYERHNLIADYLVTALGVGRDTALEDACRIEHIISDESFNKMKAFLKKRKEK
jgi:Mn-dependent DtxR family transcriptional regulator